MSGAEDLCFAATVTAVTAATDLLAGNLNRVL